jgi:GNAT superfamily N-acetyltransferase
MTIEEITRLFNSVGFSSPPSWLKPYSVLSNGEKMRVDLARALCSKKDLVVFDEFTSVVDRNVAKIGSAAVSKAIKRTDKKFIAVTCHYDVADWLEPDWIFDTNKMKFQYVRGLLRRPDVEIKIYERKGMWNIFRKYHYLNHDINNSAKQYVGFINNEPAAFCGVLHFPHPNVKNIKKCTRLVVLPDYQGLGIGNKLLEYVAQKYCENRFRFYIVTTTPALIHAFQKSKKWALRRASRVRDINNKGVLSGTESKKRFTTSWEFVLGH